MDTRNLIQEGKRVKLSCLRKSLAVVISFALLLSSLGTPAVLASTENDGQTDPQATIRTIRLAGNDCYQTAIEISKNLFPNGSDTVIMARGDDFPDALAGAPLAKKNNAPLLLTESATLTPETMTEINRLKPHKVILLGGVVVISDQIEKDLIDAGYQVIRIGGQDRYDTAQLIAEEVGNKGKAVIAYGENFPDALSISSWAASNGVPILLTDSKALPQATISALTNLQVTNTYLIGGTAVISQNIEDRLKADNMNPVRFSGVDRYETNILVNKSLKTEVKSIYLTTGLNFPDALAGAVLAAQSNSALLLVNNSLPQVTTTYLSQFKGQVETICVFGGTGIIPDNIIDLVVKTVTKDVVSKPVTNTPGNNHSGGGTTTPGDSFIVEDNDEYKLAELNGGQLPEIIYSEETGIPEFILGCYSSNKINSANDAIRSLESVKTLMKINNPQEEFVLADESELDGEKTYRLQQVYKGIPVYNRQLLVNVDGDNKTTSINGNYFPEYELEGINTVPIIDQESAIELALIAKGMEPNSDIITLGSLNIFVNDDSVPKLAWIVYIEGQSIVVIDANNGNVLATKDLVDNVSERVPGYAFNVNNIGNNQFTMWDPDRDIIVSNGTGISDARETWPTACEKYFRENRIYMSNSLSNWDPIALNLMDNFSKIYDFYEEYLGRTSFSNRVRIPELSSVDPDRPVYTNTIRVFSHMGENNNAAFSYYPTQVGAAGYFAFGDGIDDGDGINDMLVEGYTNSLDVIAHEFNHAVLKFQPNLNIIRYESSALEEAYGDITGEIIERFTNGDNASQWLLGEDGYNNGATRSLENPPSIGGGVDNYRNLIKSDSNNAMYKNTGIIDKAAYLMWRDTFSTDNTKSLEDNLKFMAKIWYKSRHSYMTGQSDFRECRVGVIQAARRLGATEAQLEGINNAFAQVGITAPLYGLRGDEWYCNYFKAAVDWGIINGYPDGSLKPENTMTNAEFLKCIVTAAAINDIPTVTTVPQWQDSWAKGYLQLALDRGWLNDIDDTVEGFVPNEPINREKAAVLMWTVFTDPANSNRNLMKDLLANSNTKQFDDDWNIEANYKDAIYYLKSSNIITGYFSNQFPPRNLLYPKQFLDRASCVSMIMKCFNSIN